MPKYINVDLLKSKIGLHSTIQALIDNLPAADVLPERHGEWLMSKEELDFDYDQGYFLLCTYTCSICGYSFNGEEDCYNEDYCPGCGAKMDKEKQGEIDNISFDQFCGIHTLSGVELGCKEYEENDCNVCLFTLDNVTYEAIEDPDDGYRSYCRELKISDKKPAYTFPKIKVFCHMMEDTYDEHNDVLIVRDIKNGKIILEVGTRNTDDYYPYCHFKYTPENMACNEDKRGS